MPLYRIHFNWKNKDVILSARSLDMTHPYFISVKRITFPKDSGLIINPSEEETFKEFRYSKHLLLPFQIINLIEEIDEDEDHIFKLISP